MTNGTHRTAAHLSVSRTDGNELSDSPLCCPCDRCREGALIGDCLLATHWELAYDPHAGLSAKAIAHSCPTCSSRQVRGVLNEEDAANRWGSEVVTKLVAWMEHAHWYRWFEFIDQDRCPVEFTEEPAPLNVSERKSAHRWKPKPGELADRIVARVYGGGL
jgi:hypothetical protein